MSDVLMVICLMHPVCANPLICVEALCPTASIYLIMVLYTGVEHALKKHVCDHRARRQRRSCCGMPIP